MAQLFNIHPTNPQKRLISKTVTLLNEGGICALPTDAQYTLACRVDNAAGHERIRTIKNLDHKHLFSLLCRDFSQISEFAQMDNECFKFLKNLLPAPYTAILKGKKNLGRSLLNPKRRTIGIRLPEHTVLQAILNEIDVPLIASTLELPDTDSSVAFAEDIRDTLEHQIAAVIDCGTTHLESTTVLDLTTEPYSLIREGIAPIPWK